MDEIILPQRCELASECFKEIEGWVLLCALEAIDTAMLASNKGWYAGFKKQEKAEADPIIEEKEDKKFETVYKLDFQAAIKMLRFRASKLKPVFTAYSLEKDTRSDFQRLLKRLNDTRNDISGHLDGESVKSKYAHMDSEEALRFLFRFREGILDLILFLSYFPGICHPDGQPYLEKARAKWNQTEKLLHVFQYQVETVIEKEKLGLTVAQFAELCRQLHIIYRTDSDGNSFLATDDYKRSVQAIRMLASGMPKEEPAPEKAEPAPIPAPPKTEKHHAGLLGAAIGVVAALLVVIIVLLVQKDDSKVQAPPSISDSPSQFQTSDTESESDKMQTEDKESQTQDQQVDKPDEIVIPRIKGANIVGGLQISVDQIPSVYLTFEYANDKSKAYSLGWVEGAKVIVETTTGKFTGTISNHSVKIEKDSTGSFSATFEEEFTGTVQSITIKNILPLGDMGLPENASTDGLSLKIPVTYS